VYVLTTTPMTLARSIIWTLSLSCSASFGSAGCRNNEPTPGAGPEMVQVSYGQTYCADRWGQASNLQQLESIATAYLSQQGVTAHHLKARVKEQPAGCNACTCTTGLVLEGLVRTTDLLTLEKLGFKKL
jgi:hypothetical protein